MKAGAISTLQKKILSMIVNHLRRRVVIVDNTVTANIYRYILESSNKYNVVSVYASFEEALSYFKKDKPDVLITEVELDGMSGVEGLREMQQLFPSVEVVVCSNVCALDVITDCFLYGAVGYLLKDESHSRLVSLLDDLMAGGSPISPTAARTLIESYRRNLHSPLTFRETEIVRLLSKGNTYTEIASTLSISPETSKSHIRNIYKKLGVNSKSLALKRVREERMI
jgi:DNA-binding NarL/FixJ family response regulator